jgi:hypothetical protein
VQCDGCMQSMIGADRCLFLEAASDWSGLAALFRLRQQSGDGDDVCSALCSTVPVQSLLFFSVERVATLSWIGTMAKLEVEA